MRTIAQPTELETAGRPVALAVGVFDGVHVGHREVISRMVEAADRSGAVAVVATFDRHPNAVVAPSRTPPAIQSTSQRLRAFAELRAEAAWLIRFDEDFSRQSGEAFVRGFVAGFERVVAVCVGSGFQFGHRRQGDVSLLRKLGTELDFETIAVEPMVLDGRVVSSTRVRELIRAGLLDEASRLLGRPYTISGEVVRGDQLGRQLGFPTANIEVTGLVLPPSGVYAARAVWSGMRRDAVMNIGCRPTVSKAAVLGVEVHVLDLPGGTDLYGMELNVTPVLRLRDEQRFATPVELGRQIEEDIRAAGRALGREAMPAAGANKS